MPHSLTVVIPAFNAASDLPETLVALATALENAPAFEANVIVVDDGSTDDTAAVATASATDLGLPLQVVSQTNQGRFEARRAGIDEATGDCVLLLDSRVTLEADSLQFVSTRLDAGQRVWNGHVEIPTKGQPYAAFWKIVAGVGWRDYLHNPRPVAFGVADFDRYPKGTGCFLSPRSVLAEAVAGFRSQFGNDRRFVSDDTAVIRLIAVNEPIHLDPAFACRYQARSTLRGFMKHGVHRGTVFVDGHLRRESRFFLGAAAFFPISVVVVLAGLRRPRLILAAMVGGGVAGGIVARRLGYRSDEARAFAWLAPIYAIVHGLGMWRGLVLLVRHRERRGP